MTRRICVSIVAIAALSFSHQAAAQGIQTATVRGVILDSTGAVAPGVTIDAQSIAEASHTTTISDATGAYSLQGLAPGEYEVTIELAGFQTVINKTRLTVGAVVTIDAELKPSTVTDHVTVT